MDQDTHQVLPNMDCLYIKEVCSTDKIDIQKRITMLNISVE